MSFHDTDLRTYEVGYSCCCCIKARAREFETLQETKSGSLFRYVKYSGCNIEIIFSLFLGVKLCSELVAYP